MCASAEGGGQRNRLCLINLIPIKLAGENGQQPLAGSGLANNLSTFTEQHLCCWSFVWVPNFSISTLLKKVHCLFFWWNDAQVWLGVRGNPLLQIDSSLNSAENKSKFLNSHLSICGNKPVPKNLKELNQRAAFAAGHFPLMCKEPISLAAQLPGPGEVWMFEP